MIVVIAAVTMVALYSIEVRSQAVLADWPQIIDLDNSEYGQPTGPLSQKAAEYDIWNAKYHHPYYGGQVGVRFSDETYSKPVDYTAWGDSCIWTGTYVGSQALRYRLTQDPVAKDNLIKAVHALDGYLHVTNTIGYIARYWAPQKSLMYIDDAWCLSRPRCHKVTSGRYQGDFWEGDTSKDQYAGWFFGMMFAYEFVGDPATEKMIRDDVVEVVDKLIASSWIILDQNGSYHVLDAAQRPTFAYQLSWLCIVYHMTGSSKYQVEIENRLSWVNYLYEEVAGLVGMFNKYYQYYGNNLAYTTWYNLLRLGKAYFPEADHKRLQAIFTYGIHQRLNLSHNPWFNAIYMSQGEYHKQEPNDLNQAQLLEDLRDFRPAPNVAYALPKRDPRPLDQMTSWLLYFPKIQEWMFAFDLKIKPQAKEAFPVRRQCFDTFIFQRNPYQLEACGTNDSRNVQPGHDYLAAYWLSAYHNFISPSD